MTWFRGPTIPVHMNYAEKTKTAVVPAVSGKQLVYIGATLNNRSGGAIIAGIGFKLDNSRWKAGLWDDSEAASYIDDTTDAQDAGTNDFALTTTTNNDGFVIQALDKFGIVGVTVGTAGAGGSPAFEYTYWNGAWTALTLIETPTWTSTGEKTLAFAPPADWTALAAADTPVATDGLTAGYYAIRVRATTAPSGTAALADIAWVARLYDYKEDVSDNAVLNAIPEDADRGIVLQGGESIIPYFGTAHANNSVTVRYAVRG